MSFSSTISLVTSLFIYFLHSKDEVLSKFREYRAMVEKQTGRFVKTLRTDNGGEYISGAFKAYLKENGIVHQLTAPYSPQQNGVAERANRTLVEAARCMLLARNISKTFWAEAIATATYVKNRCPTKELKVTPHEVWTGRKPQVEHLRVFGCKAYAHVPKEKRDKLDAKSRECLFLGYPLGSKAYRLYDVEDKRIIISRDVVFDEAPPSLSPPSSILQFDPI